MKAYLITTGSIFGLMTVIHVWRLIEEWHRPDLESFIIVLITLLTTALSAWAFQLLRTQPPRDPAGFDVIRK